MTTTMAAVLIAHAASTWFMTGAIWIVQVVHYPLFAMADRTRYAAFAAAHNTRITPVVGPAMLVELLCAVWLVLQRPAGMPAWWTWSGLSLVGIIWLSTALLQVPAHGRLAAAFDADAHAMLVATNWMRTVAWTLRAALAAAMLAQIMMRR